MNLFCRLGRHKPPELDPNIIYHFQTCVRCGQRVWFDTSEIHRRRVGARLVVLWDGKPILRGFTRRPKGKI